MDTFKCFNSNNDGSNSVNDDGEDGKMSKDSNLATVESSKVEQEEKGNGSKEEKSSISFTSGVSVLVFFVCMLINLEFVYCYEAINLIIIIPNNIRFIE